MHNVHVFTRTPVDTVYMNIQLIWVLHVNCTVIVCNVGQVNDDAFYLELLFSGF